MKAINLLIEEQLVLMSILARPLGKTRAFRACLSYRMRKARCDL